VDEAIKNHLNKNADYSSNSLNGKLIRGFDVEVINFQSLEKSYLNASEDFEKEHVTPYIYKSHSNLFKINSIEEKDLNISDIRVTLDTKEDYTLLCAVFDNLYYINSNFSSEDVIDLFNRKPWLKNINENIEQKKL
ncbi:MAG: acylneuraminate cytidylyltransferase, partial [Methanobrevibacter sp.]|nr:acylneuraminate cytidylyltransferase [Methanobrevibacter sp.]